MLRLSMLSLVCSLSSGVFGFGTEVAAPVDWAKSLFVVFLMLWVVCLVGGIMNVRSILLQAGDRPLRNV
jgi:uncharacterized membrane protein YtjA (UPF0391 family)